MTLQQRINYAKLMTKRSAAVKDYKVRRKDQRELREIARELTAGNGYIIASPNEMSQRYPKYYSVKGSERMVFAIQWNVLWRRLSFVGL